MAAADLRVPSPAAARVPSPAAARVPSPAAAPPPRPVSLTPLSSGLYRGSGGDDRLPTFLIRLGYVEPDDGTEEEGPFSPWLPPDDRLWRHPSEAPTDPEPAASRQTRRRHA